MDRDTGIGLERPKALVKENRALPRALFYGAMMALGGIGSWGSFITAFKIPVHAPWLIAAGLVFLCFSLWRETDTRPNGRLKCLVGWTVWMLLVVFLFDGAAHGAVRVGNIMLDCYGEKLSYDLPQLRLPSPSAPRAFDAAGDCTSFIVLLLFPFFWSMARMWVKGRNNRAPFGQTLGLLLLPMSLSIIPEFWTFGALLLFWCVLLLMTPSLAEGGRPIGLFKKRGHRVSGLAAAGPGALGLAVLVGLGMWLLYLWAPEETYTRPPLAESLRTAVREGVGGAQYVKSGRGNSNKDVQLRTLGSRAYTGETVLRVKFDWQQDPEAVGAFPRGYGDGETIWETYSDNVPAENADKEYLKSFVGAVYTGHSWERLDTEGREELGALELRAQNQTSRYKHELFAPGRDKYNCYRLSVQNVGANPRCVYIPASLKSGEDELAEYGIELVDDGYAKSTSLISGTGEYELTDRKSVV